MNREEIEALGRAGAAVVEYRDFRMARVLNRFWLALVEGDQSVCPHLESDGFWESWVTKWLVDNINPGDTFLDVGANTGYYAFLAASLGAKVTAFEPNPDYYDALRTSNKFNSAIKGLTVDIFQYALSDRTAFAKLTIPEHLHGSATIRGGIGDQWNPREIVVTTIALDSFAFSNGPMIIKLDVEGAEELVWRGMQKTLARHKPLITLEWTPGTYSQDFFEELQSYGVVSWITHDGNEEAVTKEWLHGQADWVMLVVRP